MFYGKEGGVMHILGFNKNPKVKTYSYHAFLNSIIDNREILNLNYYDKGKSEWETLSYDTNIIINDDVIMVDDSFDTKNREGFIFRDCKSRDELSICINNIDKTNEHPILNMFISDGSPQICAGKNKGIYRFGIHRYGVMISYDEKIIKDIPVNYNSISWFRLVYKNKCTYAYISSDSKEWQLVEKVSNVTGSNLKIGLNYNNLGSAAGNIEYLNWLYSNYIQIKYSKDENVSIPIDYYMIPVKNFRYEANYAYYYVDVQYFSLKEIVGTYNNLGEFIKQSINNQYYPVISLDEYYIPNRNAYKKYHFFHHNLIYGYDDNKKIYMIAGYADRPVYGQISYDTVMQSEIDSQSDIIRIKRIKNKGDYSFKKSYVDTLIKAYRDGKPCINYVLFPNDENCVYGLKIFEELLETERGRNLVTTDVRVSYILYEHCSIMYDRLSYLKEKRYIRLDSKRYEELESKCIKMVNTARALNLMVVKNIIGKSDDKKVLSELEKLYNAEKEFYYLNYFL